MRVCLSACVCSLSRDDIMWDILVNTRVILIVLSLLASNSSLECEICIHMTLFWIYIQHT